MKVFIKLIMVRHPKITKTSIQRLCNLMANVAYNIENKRSIRANAENLNSLKHDKIC